MSMQVTGGSVPNTNAPPAQQWQQRQQNVKALTYALQSGNLNAARSAYQSLIAAAGRGRDTSANSALAAVGRALDSGDLAGAARAAKAVHTPHHGTPWLEGRRTGAGANPPNPTARGTSGVHVDLLA